MYLGTNTAGSSLESESTSDSDIEAGPGTTSALSLLSFSDLLRSGMELNSEMLGITEKGNNIFLCKVLTEPLPNSFCTLYTCTCS